MIMDILAQTLGGSTTCIPGCLIIMVIWLIIL